MTHNPEQLAASYLGGMRPRARLRFESHLIDCEACWSEVSLARQGREIAESARPLAPAGLREHIRAVIADDASHLPPPKRRLRLALAGATAVAAAASAVVIAVQPWAASAPKPQQDSDQALAAAVANYRSNQLLGTAVPDDQAPDLGAAHLTLVAGAAGRLDGVPVTMFVYRTSTGTRLTIYRSAQPFPEAAEARDLGAQEESAWTVRSDGVTVICGRGTHSMLLLSTDAALVEQASAWLNAV